MAAAKPTLQIVIGSTRPGRVGSAVAQWFYDFALAYEGFEVELVDLAQMNLPLFDEPHHPMNAAIKNAVDYLYHEWRYKPFGLVCYGGGARGLRAAQALKLSLVSLKMFFAGDVAIGLGVTPVVEGVFDGDEQLVVSAGTLLDELARLTPLFQSLRA